jgi:hypothetical protein
MDKIIRNILIRQIPLILVSIITGSILVYYLGFWAGIFVNSAAWSAAVLAAKIYMTRNGKNMAGIRNDRYLMYFVLGLIGRNK